MRIKNIAFFGFSEAGKNSQAYNDAFQTARILAERGFVIINGGGPGVMKAATLGAKTVGGKTIGVTFYPKEMTNFEGRDPENPIDKEIKTANYLERTLKLIDLADCFVVFKGGTGTISEFAMAWGLAHLYFGHHKPLILFGDFWHEVILTLKKYLNLNSQEIEVLKIATRPEDVLKILLEIESKLEKHKHKHNGNSEEAFQL